MAISTSLLGNSTPERDIFGEFRKKDNVENIKDKFSIELKDLQKNIQNENLKKRASSPDQLLAKLDDDVEDMFDGWADKNKDRIQTQVKNNNIDAIQKKFNDEKLSGFMDYIDEIKNREIQELIDYNYFQLETLSFDVLKSSIQQNNNSTNTNTSAGNPNEGPLWRDPNDISKQYEESPDFIISKNPKDRSYQELSPLTWNADLDANGNGKTTKGELKNAGILDPYRQSDTDVRKSVEKIISWAEVTLKKHETKGIDWQSLRMILGDIVRDYYEYTNIRDNKEFKKYFKENFLQRGEQEYKKKGGSTNNDIKKILSILEKGLDDDAIREALKDVSDTRHINIVGASNDITHLESGAVNSKNMFLFLCDFDSDGSVNSTNIIKQKPNESRRDTGSVMGLQLYQNFAVKATIDDKNNIVNGPKTTALIRNIIIGVKSKVGKDSSLFVAVNAFIKSQDELKTSGYSIQSFLDFMKGKNKYAIGGKQTKVIGVTGVKSYLKSLAQETNEGSGDVADIFVNADERKENLKNNAEGGLDVSRIYGVIDLSLATRGNDYGEETLAYTRRTIADQVIKSINIFTDSLYANLDTDGKLAQLFHGTIDHAAIGKIQQTFYFPDGTRNEQLIKDELGKYINKRVVPSFGVAADEKGNPVIGAGIGVYKTSEDLTKRFQFNLNIGAILPAFNRANSAIPSDFKIGISVDIERTRQTKGSKRETKNQGRKDLVPATRVGFVVGAGFEFVTQTIGLKAGIVIDRDFPAGIEQKGREFDRLLKTILDPTATNFVNGNDYANKLKQKIAKLAEDDSGFQQQKRFLDDMADALGQKMEWAGVFDILNSPEYRADNGKKSVLLNFFYNQFIDGFHENAINQDLYNQLAGQGVKLTKVSIGVMVATTITAIALAPITAGASSALMVAGFASMKLSTFRNSFSPDAYKTQANYQEVQTHKNMEEAPEFTNLGEAAKYLEQQLNALEPGKENMIKVTPDENNGTFKIGLNGAGIDQRNIKRDTIFKVINIYYDTEDISGFRFENGELIIGKADLHIGRIVKRDRVEVHLMLGKNYKNMTKLDGPVHTETDKPLAGYEKTPESPKLLTKEVVESLVNTIDWTNIEPDKQKLIDFVWKESQKNTPPLTRGTLTLKKYPDGAYKLSYARDEKTDKLTLNYELIVDTKKLEWKEVSESNKTRDLARSFGYIENPNTEYQKLRNELESLEKNNKKELCETSIAAINRGSSPDLLFGFLDALSTMNYDKASEKLIVVLNKKKVDAYIPFITKLEDKNLDLSDRILLCNKFRQLLAYNPTTLKLLTNAGYDKVNIHTIGGLITRRKNAYESMAKSSALPEMFRTDGEYYKTLTSQVASWGTYELADAHSVLGYTAFYRTASKSFGMGHPGETKIVKNGNNLAKVDVKKDDVEKTSDRYFNKLRTNEGEFTIIKNTINSVLKNAGSSYKIETIDQFKALVLNKKIETLTANKKTKEILTLDSKFVFYLMGECTNESLGLELGKITLSKSEEVPTETADTGKSRTGSITPGKKPSAYKIGRASGIYNNEYDIQTRQRDLTIGGAIRGMIKGKQPDDNGNPRRDGQSEGDNDGRPGRGG